MDWVLVGYLAKRRATRMSWASLWPDHPESVFPCAPPVEEICSVSNCIARSTGRAENPADGNPLGLHTDAGMAWAAVPKDARADYALYGYRLWPMQYAEGQEEEINLWWEPDLEALPKTFVRLGWDAVVGGNENSFGCSPMSCNAGCDVVRCAEINRYCLVANAQAAKALAYRFSITQPEPGPYCVVEVWRDSATVSGQSD